ncbi:MAG: hypothetical protein ABFD25_03290 [Clostridiaceae bacterium]
MIDKLNERLKELTIQRQQAQTLLQKVSADILKIAGAIGEIERLISQEKEGEQVDS